MGIAADKQGLVEHVEAIDVIGETKCWIRDLEEAWIRQNETTRVLVTREAAAHVLETVFPAPRSTVWEFVTSPVHHARWQRSDSVG